LAFGVLLSTVVTLFVVPSGYVILEDLRSAFRKDTGSDALDLTDADLESGKAQP